MGFIAKIGNAHLQDNEFFRKRQYSELDVVCFDKNRFIHDLYKNDKEDTMI